MSQILQALQKIFTLTQVGSRRFGLEHLDKDKLLSVSGTCIKESDFDFIGIFKNNISIEEFLITNKNVRISYNSYILGSLFKLDFYIGWDFYQITILEEDSYYKQVINNNIIDEYLKNISPTKFKLIKDLKHKYLASMSGSIFFYELLELILSEYGSKPKINFHDKSYGGLMDYPDRLNAQAAIIELKTIFDLDC